MMVHEELKIYFDSNLSTPSLSFEWSEDDNTELFNYIEKKYPVDFLKDKSNLLQIKQALKDYFESIGYILFAYKNKTIRLKIFPYTVEPQDSVNIEAIVEIIHLNDDLITYDYKDITNQLLVQKALIHKIHHYLIDAEEENVNKKELIKYCVREAFELEENDVIIYKQGHIFVKIVEEKEIIENVESKIAKMYNNIDEEELLEFDIEFFSDEQNKDFLKLIAKIFVQKYLIDKKISNDSYENNAFEYIQKIIFEEITSLYDDDDTEFFKGFAGFTFRRYFKDIYEHIAELILLEVALSNPQISEFLEYYSLNAIVMDGRKYRVPTLDAGNGLKWSVISMLSIARIYTKTENNIKVLEEELKEIDDKIEELYIDGLSPREYQNSMINKRKEIEEIMEEESKELEKCHDSLKLSKDPKERRMLNQEIINIKIYLEELVEDKSILADEMLDVEIIEQYYALEDDTEYVMAKLKREKKILKQNEETYVSIKHAIISALISKKQLI